MIEFFRAAAAAGTRSQSTAMPDTTLGFLLQYDGVPDLATQRDRMETLFGAGGFDLFMVGDEDPDLLVLVFRGVTLEQPPDFLFQAADWLRTELDVLAVEPETGAPFTDLLSRGPTVEGLADVVDWVCSSSAPAHADPLWPLKMMKVDRAQAAHGVTGAGVRIGQPDTGVAEHVELAGALNLALAGNFVDGGTDPTDPLLTSMASPGHGTGAASVVISRPAHRVTGSAPGAELVPIRVVNGVVFGLGLAVARGIDHARAKGCHIVSISLGSGFAGRALRRAVARAVAANMIVVVAAGNCVRFVTYPGWDRNAITLAGVDRNGNRWRGSCRGKAVDVAAPAENVHRAHRAPGPVNDAALHAIEDRAQGTTFATAMTAGVAALWLEKFGRNALIAEAHGRGWPLQELFRAALRQTANRPGGWDTERMGAGIVDAEALLNLAPGDIVGGAGPAAESPALAVFGRDFDGSGLQAEADFMAFSQMVHGDAGSRMMTESQWSPQPSERLAAELGADAPLAGDLKAPVVVEGTSPEVSAPITDALRRVSAAQGDGLESASAVDSDTALQRLRSDGPEALLDRAAEAFGRQAGANAGVQAEALARMRPVLEAVAGPDGGLSELPETEARGVLEALVRLTGRPAVRLRADGSEIEDPRLESWRDVVAPMSSKWRVVTDAVGRIDVEVSPGKPVHAGTGVLIADGRVLTNRHVIDLFAVPIPSPDGEQKFLLRWPTSIIFDPDARDEATRFELPSVLSAGRHRIGRRVNLGKLDAAVLEMNMDNGTAEPPLPVDPLARSAADAAVSRLLVSGYPAKPTDNSGPDAQDEPELHADFWNRLTELYGGEYGVQYISPGTVDLRPGSVPDDPQGWAFTHDATTLGGNSGSIILSLDGNAPLCGLHFGGETLSANYAHDLLKIAELGDGVFSTDLLPFSAP